MTNTPDYQGVFLRGFGSQSSSHYGVTIHSSGGLGILQGDAIRNITGGVAGGSVEESGASAFGAIYISGSYPGSGTGWSDSGWRLDASRVVPTANENRPINKAVNYLIRAK